MFREFSWCPAPPIQLSSVIFEEKRMKILSLLILSLAMFLAGCEDPAANKPKATTSEPAANKPANETANSGTTPAGKGEAMAITPANSTVLFTGSKVTGRHEGGFKRFAGTIDLVNGKPEESSVSVDIETDSLFVDDAKLADHLKTKDFFDVATFPKATFKSTMFTPGGVGGANYTVTGDLELHGQKKAITFPAKIDVADDSVTVKAGFSINRKDFGIVYAGKADDLIRDDVVIFLDLKTPRKK